MFTKIKKTAVVTGLCISSLFLSQIYAQMPFVNIQNNMRIDKKSGVPVAIYNVNSCQYTGTPEEIARQYLIENRALLGMEENLSDLELIEVKESPAGHHVGFRQVYKDIPVMRSETVVSINHQNRVSMVINGHKPNISVNSKPSIGKKQVLELAKQAIGAGEEEIFPSKVGLMVYEDSVRIFHLIWKVLVFPSEPVGEWLVIVDAHSGKVFEKFNTVFSHVDGTGRVFNPDPVTALQEPTLTDKNDEDYPALQPAYDKVTLNDLNEYGLYRLQGKYVWSKDIQYPYDDIIYERDPDNFTYNRSHKGFEEVNIYYFVDKQRRYVGSLGDFNPKWDAYFDIDPQAIAFDARGFTDRNAGYYPVKEYLSFGVPSNYVDAGEDQSLILHEYGHALHDALIIGGTDNAPYESDTRGVSEGIADYLGISYRRTTQSDPFRPNYRCNWFYPELGIWNILMQRSQ